MKVTITAIGQHVTRQDILRAADEDSPLLLPFASDCMTGAAAFTGDLERLLLGHSLPETSVEASADFESIEDGEVIGPATEGVQPLETPRDFHVRGVVLDVHPYGLGLLIRARCLNLIIEPRRAPAAFLRLPPGGWVSFTLRGLIFWI